MTEDHFSVQRAPRRSIRTRLRLCNGTAADVEPASDVVGSTEWWEKMTNPNPPETGSGDNPT
jgi:hypothetical protein